MGAGECCRLPARLAPSQWCLRFGCGIAEQHRSSTGPCFAASPCADTLPTPRPSLTRARVDCSLRSDRGCESACMALVVPRLHKNLIADLVAACWIAPLVPLGTPGGFMPAVQQAADCMRSFWPSIPAGLGRVCGQQRLSTAFRCCPIQRAGPPAWACRRLVIAGQVSHAPACPSFNPGAGSSRLAPADSGSNLGAQARGDGSAALEEAEAPDAGAAGDRYQPTITQRRRPGEAELASVGVE